MSRFLTIVNGARRLASAITSSLGSADGNKIVATKSNGRLDNSLIEWASPDEIGSSTPSAGNFTNLRTTRSASTYSNNSLVQAFDVDGVPAFGIYAIGQASNPNAQRLVFATRFSSSGDPFDQILEFTKFAGQASAKGVWSFTFPIIIPRNASAAPDPFFYTRGLSFVGASDATAYLNYSLAGSNFRVPGISVATETLTMPYATPSTSTNTGAIVIPGLGGLAVGGNIHTGGSLNLNGLVINANGAIQTRGIGTNTVVGNARGTGAVDLQTARDVASSVSSGLLAFIGGGRNNTASNSFCAVSGGRDNVASGSLAFIGGGEANTASATYASVPGGNRGVANKYGQQAHASGRFAADGDAQRSSLVARTSTADATPTNLTLDGTSATLLTLANNQAWKFTIEVIAKQVSSANHAAFRIEGTATKGTTNASTAISSSGISKTSILNDTGWDLNVSADTTNGALQITATGAAATSIRWVAAVNLVEVIA